MSAAPPVLGRDSPAAAKPSRLRRRAAAADAAYRADGGDLGAWAVRAASVSGVRHRLAGDGPQDAYAWRVIGSGADGAGAESLVVAIADGVGTVLGAAAAAAVAVTAACDAAAESLATGSVATGSVATGSGAVGSVATQTWWSAVVEAADVAVRAVGGATTLVVACIDEAGAGSLARIGDSTAMILTGGSWQEIWPPAGIDGAPVSTETEALPGSRRAEIAAVSIEAGTALVLMTDG
ncbi:MAG TPA: protein phosphatase 2C domain-containing protein, partial [Acidimicrobiales bacterium]